MLSVERRFVLEVNRISIVVCSIAIGRICVLRSVGVIGIIQPFVVVNFVQSPFTYMRRYDVSRGRRLGDRGTSQAIFFLELLFGTVLGLYAGRLPVANLDWLGVGDRRRLDDNRRDGVGIGVLGGGSYGCSSHPIGGVLSLYRPFTYPASAVV